MKKIIFLFLISIILFPLFSQEQLKSIEENYYDFLSIQGLTERSTLAYRTMSDSVWKIKDNDKNEHIWQDQNIGRFISLFDDFKMRVYGPDLFMSYNTANPYGQNDGVLWQGKGFNTLLKGGARFEGYGLEITILPHLAFSQNQYYKIMPSFYANEYGYFWGLRQREGTYAGADAPQRFGDKPFFDWDFGDTEIRYTWKTLTIGFGTQAIWTGPSYINSMLLSNNAPAYPKLDFGLRKTSTNIFGKYIGDIEARLWTGRLTESDYFDDIPENDYTMLHGLSIAYAPSFISGLTLFFNRICLIEWDLKNIRYIIPERNNTIEDQKMSAGFSWIFTKVGLEIYGELGIDDFPYAYIEYPFHLAMYSIGMKKSFILSKDKNLHGMFVFEWNSMEISQNLQLVHSDSFYFHGYIIHGHTNRGQWLGAGTGYSGNSQYIGFTFFYPEGSTNLFIQRSNPDNNFIYNKAVNASAEGPEGELFKLYFDNFKGMLDIGINTNYFFNNNLNLGAGIVYNLIVNPYFYFYKTVYNKNEYIHNFSFQFSLKYYL